MGEAKRRKQLDPSYGQPRPLPEVVNLKALTGAYTESEVERILSEDTADVDVVNFVLGLLLNVPVVAAGPDRYRPATPQEVLDLKRAGKIPKHSKDSVQGQQTLAAVDQLASGIREYVHLRDIDESAE
jgi:hypothetical protein